jgi:hypothetical protein
MSLVLRDSTTPNKSQLVTVENRVRKVTLTDDGYWLVDVVEDGTICFGKGTYIRHATDKMLAEGDLNLTNTGYYQTRDGIRLERIMDSLKF